ncbi:hypothetical protein QKY98_08635 [Pseudomonas sp. HR1]|uniref:hypothetical protein n=1 Tax=Pseudomonas sp. HR1 TaxID=1463361 RepID=UPI002543839A|nr:hypothetical protein [Pseudomonas sp. HR1]MDK4199181.1 hypothetical protein [Pseudomonas sp. HR1]
MDLIYYSHFSHIDFDHFRPSSVDMFYPAVEDLLPLCVESEPVFNQRLAQFDDRKSSLTLVWRGVRDSELIKEVQEMLDDNAPLLIDSFESGQEGDVEWLLSPIIAKCSESLSKSKRRKLMKAARLRLVMLVTLAYLIAALVAFVMFFLKR